MNIVIDCTAIDSRAAFHDAFAQALFFPNWYGNNLDALHDLLAAISEETCLHLRNWSAAESALGNYAKAAKKALDHAAGANPRLTVEYC